MNEFIERLKYEFSKGSMLIRLIYLNIGVYVSMLLLNFVFHLFNIEFQTIVFDYFSLHADGVEFITKPWTLLTYSLLHSGFGHIFFNMLILYSIGQIFLQYLSEKQLLSLYILGVIAGGLFFVVSINIFPIFEYGVSYYSIVGASAGVMAVLIAIATYVPNYNVRLILFGNVKLWHLAFVFILIDLVGYKSNEGGHMAHFGGIIIGYLYAKQLHKGKDIAIWINSIISKLVLFFTKEKTPFKKVYKNESPRDDYEYNMSRREHEEMVDDILGKISKSGYESLTKQEKEFLFRAGKK